MSDHKHSHANHPHHDHAPKKGLHQDWRFLAAVGLMIAAMVAYVMSLDEEVLPDGEVQQATPAAE